MQYDLAGNLRKITDPNSKIMTFAYSSGNEVTGYTDGNNNTSTYAYDGNEDLVTYTKPNGKDTNLVYDQYGRLTRWHQFYQVGDSSYYEIWKHERRFAYDALSRVTARTDFYEQGTWDEGHWVPDNESPPMLEAPLGTHSVIACGRSQSVLSARAIDFPCC